MYLGANIYKYHVNRDISGTECWAMSADSHVKKAVEFVQDMLREDNIKFKSSNKTAEQPFSRQLYRPELDVTEEGEKEQVQFYQILVGIMRWLCDIRRIDILTETSLLPTYLSCPRVRHLHQALHVFKYLKDHKRSKCVFDPTYVDINDDHLPREERSATKAKYMKELYPDAVEDKPTNAPPPKRKKGTNYLCVL